MAFEPDRQQWQQVKAVLTQALRVPSADREALVRDAISDDAALRHYVFDVLRSYERSTKRFDLLQQRETFFNEETGTSPLQLNDGDLVGPYRVLRRLAAGGMGVVFLAEDERLGRRVALKVVSALPGDKSDLNRRLMDESRSAALLNHPGIVTLHDVIETRGGIVAVMEYIEGRPLSELIVDGPLPLGFALLLARQIAEALSYAHGRGIIHCDLKPANIQVLPSGAPKILDFGLARIVDPSSGANRVDGPIFGTPGYMSPERLLGREPTAAADVYALGVILYELLTATPPFRLDDDAQSFLDTITAIPPAPSTIVAGIPPAVDDLVLRCLAKSPRERLQPHEVVRVLNEALFVLDAASHSVPLSSVPRSAAVDASTEPRSRSYRLAAAAAGSMVAVSFLGFITSVSFNQPLGRTGEFAVETAAAWPLWGVRSLVAVIGGAAVLSFGFIAVRGVGRLTLAAIPPLGRIHARASATAVRWLRPLHDAPNALLASAVLLAQLLALGLFIWRFQSLIAGIDGFMIQRADADLRPLSPVNRPDYSLMGKLLTLQLVLFGWGWYRLAQRGRARGERDAQAVIVSGVVILAFCLVLFQTAPFRILYQNSAERVTFESRPCYLVGQRSDDALLFCPTQSPPWSRIVKSSDPALKREGTFENIFARVGPPGGEP